MNLRNFLDQIIDEQFEPLQGTATEVMERMSKEDFEELINDMAMCLVVFENTPHEILRKMVDQIPDDFKNDNG